MTTLTRKDVLTYMFTPQLGSRCKQLFSSGFHYIPYFIALVYQIVRLLPNNHPYLNPRNIGQYGIRQVVAAAANNLVLSRRNIDQIVLFFAVLIGLVIIVIQIAMIGMMLFMQPALAAMPDTLSGFFILGEPGNSASQAEAASQDLAYIFLDMVFGVEGMFNSCVSTSFDCKDVNGEAIVNSSGEWLLSHLGTFPFPIHVAMHQLFMVYSTGLLCVAVLIACYFIATIILETAQTGTPFGKRFNKVWAPIRMVVAIGLLMPVQYDGLNSAQIIVLYAAKFGSSFATNGWNLFYETLATESGYDSGDPDTTQALSNALVGGSPDGKFVSVPNPPEIGPVFQMLFTAKICQELEEKKHGKNIEAWLVKTGGGATGGVLNIDAGGGDPIAYTEMLKFIDGATQATIRFGYESKEDYSQYTGNIGPTCGEIVLPLLDPRMPGPESANPPEEGVRQIQEFYWIMISKLWLEFLDRFYNEARIKEIHKAGNLWKYNDWYYNANTPYIENFVKALTSYDANAEAELPIPEMTSLFIQGFQKDLNHLLIEGSGTDESGYISCNMDSSGIISIFCTSKEGAVKAQEKDDAWRFSDDLLEKGWAGAGIWYNKIAQVNGSLSAAVYNVPIIQKYPYVMEKIMAKKRASEQMLLVSERFRPNISDKAKKELGFDVGYEMQFSEALWAEYKYWDAANYGASSFTTMTGNTLVDMLSQFLGTDGLFSMRKNTNVHPLAQLVGVGRSMIQAGIRSLGFSVGAAVIGGAMSLIDQTGKTSEIAANVVISTCMTIAMIGFTAGFVLFYVVPFLPFIYFFFAVGGWIKGIFEAMVGTPLWALAHIRIDGNGLPGQAAANGYYLIFEIFLRPILIVFGMIASLATFSSIVYVLNSVWDIAVGNLAGFDHSVEFADTATRTAMGAEDKSLADIMRGPVDQFFFTVIYTIVVYMMAMSSFKLIDLVPNNILRWMGQSVSTFNDQNQNAAEGLVGKASVGGQQALRSVGGGVEGMLKSMASKEKS